MSDDYPARRMPDRLIYVLNISADLPVISSDEKWRLDRDSIVISSRFESLDMPLLALLVHRSKADLPRIPKADILVVRIRGNELIEPEHKKLILGQWTTSEVRSRWPMTLFVLFDGTKWNVLTETERDFDWVGMVIEILGRQPRPKPPPPIPKAAPENIPFRMEWADFLPHIGRGASATKQKKPSHPVEQHRMGSILWSLPQRMRVGQRERVEVRIGDARVAESQLRAGLKGRGIPETDKLEVASLMRVTLISNPKDFDIDSLSSADQYMRPRTVARWDFHATPLRGGTRTLRILVSMRVKVEGKDEVIDLPSYERDVFVAVAPFHTTSKFISKNWQWVAGTVLIPLLAWAVTKTDATSALLKQVIASFSTK
jgi:hypothetical protein